MAQPYSPHPAGLQQHPGMAQGHPMAAGHPQQGGQPGTGMPQMHMGVSGPGGPQVSQAGAMLGVMPPGAGGPGGPSAHALQHLNPNQAAMYQQQQQQQAQMACKYFSCAPGLLISAYGRSRTMLIPNSCQSTNAHSTAAYNSAAATTTTGRGCTAGNDGTTI